MGCTSSAPNVSTPKSNTAEKSIQFEVDISDGDSNEVDQIIYRTEENKKKVLPSCDTLTERIHVVRNKSNPSLHSEKDHGNGILRDSTIDTTTVQLEEKTPKLEEVVDKVVKLHNIEIVDEIKSIVPKNESDHNNQENNENGTVEDHSQKDITGDAGQESGGDQKLVEEHPVEASPSQSESSRATATRWEALADIAAELPPSLAVDPITGQIYALSK